MNAGFPSVYSLIIRTVVRKVFEIALAFWTLVRFKARELSSFLFFLIIKEKHNTAKNFCSCANFILQSKTGLDGKEKKISRRTKSVMASVYGAL